MSTVYATCKSYRDTGVLTNAFSADFIDVKTFQTVFVRSVRFRFEFQNDKRKRYIVWAQSNEVLTWWDIDPGTKKHPSLDDGLAGATGVSSGAAHTIPVLLLPNDITGRKLTDLTDLVRLSDEMLGKT